jgi:hypothetical protein
MIERYAKGVPARLNHGSIDLRLPGAHWTYSCREKRENSQAMQVEPSDVHHILEYRADAELAGLLPIGLPTIFCALFLFASKAPDLPPLGTTIEASAAIAAGLGITGLVPVIPIQMAVPCLPYRDGRDKPAMTTLGHVHREPR